MLVEQAKCARDIFLGDTAPFDTADAIYKMLKDKIQNIVLIGMPSTGKTTIGKALAERRRLPFIDTDEEIVKMAKMTIPEIFEKHGEPHFRQIESQVVHEVGKKSGHIIACGGGAILTEGAHTALAQNGVIVHLFQNPERTDLTGRPLLKNIEDVKKLHKERMPIYKKFANIEIATDSGNIEQILEELEEKLNEHTCD